MSFFINRYKEWNPDFKEEYSPMNVLRVNTLRTKEEEIIKRLQKNGVKLKKIPWLKYGYSYEADFSLGSTPEYLLGYYYLQDAASQFAVQVLAPQSDEVILDACAAPGSKTTMIAQMMNNEGIIIAADNNVKRLQSLMNNTERCSCKNIVAVNKDALFIDEINKQFDRILLDVPCSGNYCIEEEWFTKRQIADIKQKAEMQKKLLKAVTKVLKSGGTLVYSTCSLEKEENEEVIEWALDNLPLTLQPIEADIGSSGLTEKTKLCKRFWPYKTNTQGFFVAKLEKK